MTGLRVLLHDFCGHPFQAQLSRRLAGSGADVTHAFCASYVTGQGDLTRSPDDPAGLAFAPLSMSGGEFVKYSPLTRLKQEAGYARRLHRLVRRTRPDVLVLCNTPLVAHALLLLLLRLGRRRPAILYWHQDVISAAMRAEAVRRLGRPGVAVGFVADRVERSFARTAERIVVIADTFLEPHRRWGTEHKTRVIPNWAPVDDVTPRSKSSAWSREHGLDARPVVLYAGTLGLKHDPELLVALARSLAQDLPGAQVVVVSEGVGADYVREHGAGLPITVLPFQPFEDLPEVLGSADVLVTLLEPEASDYSVPSKTLTYLCAGRPVLGFLRPSNPAADLIRRGGGVVFDITAVDREQVRRTVLDLLTDDEVRDRAGRRARDLAEAEFDIDTIVRTFGDELRTAAAGRRAA